MTYRQGEIITAVDINTFREDTLTVYDVGFADAGYGQIDAGGQSALPSVVIGETVKSAEWEAMRAAAQTCADHQGSTVFLPPAPELAVGEIVEAHEFLDGNTYDINDSIIFITNSRLNVDASSVTVFSNVLNSTRNTAWMNELQHRFTATFSTVDRARYFFNSGGEIRFRGSRSGGSATPQNDSWTGLLANMGTIYMNYTFTSQLGGGPGWTGSSIGYYDLTTSFQQIAIGVPQDGGYGGYSGSYGGYGGPNRATIEARTTDGPTGPNGDRGRVLEFRILYTDGHTNPFADEVDGTITSDIDYRKATSPLVVDSPIFASSINLTAGT